MNDNKIENLTFKVHTPNLLNEVLCNPSTWALKIPLQILGQLLYRVAERASELNDKKLNALMMELTLYEVADPKNPNYDEKLVNEFSEYLRTFNN